MSVAMATYNGQRYIRQQLDSIIGQLRVEDELVVSDDGSNDGTTEILHEYSHQFSNIKLIEGPRRGAASNFVNAINCCKEDIVFLCDQDDIWLDTKIDRVTKALSDNDEIALVLHNGLIFSENINEGNRGRLIKHYHPGVLQNILSSSYWGCCMAFKKTLLEDKISIYDDITAHDQLIGLLAERKRAALYLDEDLMFHRVHLSNVSKKLSVHKKIQFRMNVAKEFMRIALR